MVAGCAVSRPRTYGDRVATAIRLPTDLHAQLQEAADARDVSVNWLITRAVEQLLGRLGPTEPVATRAPYVPEPIPDEAYATNGTRRRWFR